MCVSSFLPVRKHKIKPQKSHMIRLVQTPCGTTVPAWVWLWGSLAYLVCPETLFPSRMKLSVHPSHLASGSRCWCWGQSCNEAWIVLQREAGPNAQNGRTLQHLPFCPNPDIASRGAACHREFQRNDNLGTWDMCLRETSECIQNQLWTAQALPRSQWTSRIIFPTHQVASSAKYLSAHSF